MADAEWRFTKDCVPDDELVACLLWEFLRESQTSRQLAQDWSEWFARGKTDNSDMEQTVLRGRTNKIKPSLNNPLRFDDFISMVVVQCFGFKKLIDSPWQRLSTAGRKYIVQRCNVNPPVFVGTDLHLTMLNEAMRSKEPNEGEALVKAKAMMQDLNPGQELMLLVVDWARYDNASIKKEFLKLIKELPRPDGIRPQVRKASGLGRLSEWRGKLSDLGISRLSRYQARQLKREMPNVYELLASTLSDAGPTAVERKMASARRRFKASFHEILTFEKKAPLCLVNSRFSPK